jgi:hypothetical protein
MRLLCVSICTPNTPGPSFVFYLLSFLHLQSPPVRSGWQGAREKFSHKKYICDMLYMYKRYVWPYYRKLAEIKFPSGHLQSHPSHITLNQRELVDALQEQRTVAEGHTLWQTIRIGLGWRMVIVSSNIHVLILTRRVLCIMLEQTLNMPNSHCLKRYPTQWITCFSVVSFYQ